MSEINIEEAEEIAELIVSDIATPTQKRSLLKYIKSEKKAWEKTQETVNTLINPDGSQVMREQAL